MYYPIVVAVLTLLNQGNLIHVTILLDLVLYIECTAQFFTFSSLQSCYVSYFFEALVFLNKNTHTLPLCINTNIFTLRCMDVIL
jgi:hypothetical protein